jgi:hypothetical protein
MNKLCTCKILVLIIMLCSTMPSLAFNSPPRSEVIVKNPDNPKGMPLRRARHPGEAWTDYFQNVLLWPHTADYDNRLFTSMSQNGLRIAFIPETIFAVDGELILVLRGNREMVAKMSTAVFLDGIGQRIRLAPVRTKIIEDPRGDAWLGLVYFEPPEPLPERMMSSFALFGDAGGVADILNEEQVRRRYAVLRDLADVIIEELLNKPVDQER